MADSLLLIYSMPFSKFTNPYQDPANVPEKYRKHHTIGKLFRADGTYLRPIEDPVTLWAIEILETEYSVPLAVMRLELSTLFAELTGSKKRDYQGRADLVIVDDRFTVDDDLDLAFIMVEAMEPGKKFEGIDPEGWNDHYDRLKAYVFSVRADTLIPVPNQEIQQEILQEISHRRSEARRLRAEAEVIVTEAKARVERMILGERM